MIEINGELATANGSLPRFLKGLTTAAGEDHGIFSNLDGI